MYSATETWFVPVRRCLNTSSGWRLLPAKDGGNAENCRSNSGLVARRSQKISPAITKLPSIIQTQPLADSSKAETLCVLRHNSSMKSKTLCLLALLGLLACGQASEAPQAQTVENARRTVAIGDIHSDINVMRNVFRLAGAINADDEWIGGELTIVQLGDLIGRSDDEREVLDFMFALQEEAAVHGGRVYGLIGNHEIMAARVDNQAVGPNPFAAYEDVQDLDMEDGRLVNLPINQMYRAAALMAGGPYAVRLAEFPAVLKLQDTIYVHGGVVPRWAEYGIEQINADISAWLRGDTLREPSASQRVDDSDRVMWARHFSARVDPFDCQMLQASLDILEAERMIVAHTRHSQITPYCDGRIWVIDTGMSRAYGGQIQALELIDDEVTRILDPDGHTGIQAP